MTRCTVNALAPLCPTKDMDHPTRNLQPGTVVGTIGQPVNGGPNGTSRVVKVFVPVVDYSGWMYVSQLTFGAQASFATGPESADVPKLQNTTLLPPGFEVAEIFIAGGDQDLHVRNITGEAPENKSYAWIMMHDGDTSALPLGDSTYAAPQGATIIVGTADSKDVGVMIEWERA